MTEDLIYHGVNKLWNQNILFMSQVLRYILPFVFLPDIKYVLIGAGTGVFLVAGCIILMACREKLCDGYTAPQIHSQHSNRSRTSRAGSVTGGQLTNFTKM
ncbi:hypothetical protein CgunFtcFv8_001530 [Champsocephalus gunnari]|uniref:Uncharacterized protein n=1 Tax=Champsocephalus gunnari TaxID=52237 RepID=A0AAN8CL17_CHAGU|nr:hypothetical protein CgunFtcFv8_001530 [Champsocephalus gunnari]